MVHLHNIWKANPGRPLPMNWFHDVNIDIAHVVQSVTWHASYLSAFVCNQDWVSPVLIPIAPIHQNHQSLISMQRLYFSCIGISIVKIRRSYLYNGNPCTGRTVIFYLEGPWFTDCMSWVDLLILFLKIVLKISLMKISINFKSSI